MQDTYVHECIYVAVLCLKTMVLMIIKLRCKRWVICVFKLSFNICHEERENHTNSYLNYVMDYVMVHIN